MSEGFLFRRRALARSIADEALGLDPLEGNSGLFLAAPRRTGKSTFIKVDLEPEMHKRGVLTVYVDLWADRAREPGELISDAIKSAIQSLDSGIVKLARRAGMSNSDDATFSPGVRDHRTRPLLGDLRCGMAGDDGFAKGGPSTPR